MSMHSLHVIGSTQMGGADQFYVRLVEALNQAGHRATALNRAGSPIARRLAEGPTPQLHLPLANKWDLWSRWRLRRLAAALAADVVQTYMGRATRLTRLPTRGRAVHIARLGGYYKIRGYYEHPDAWVGNTRGVCDHLIRHGLPAGRVHLIGNFVPEPRRVDPAELLALGDALGLPAGARVLFTLGRFIGIKGFDDLLKAFGELPSALDGRPLHLVIGGDGPLRADLLRLADDLGLAARVHFPGWLADPAPYYALAELMVCPSRHETLGNVILEGWSYRKPVVATTTPGATELIRDTDNGLLCEIADPGRLAVRLRDALEAPAAARARLAEAGHVELLAHHGRDAVVRQYLELYAKLTRSG